MKNQPEPPPPPFAPPPFPFPAWPYPFPPAPSGPSYAEVDARADAAALDLKCRVLASLTAALERARSDGRTSEDGLVEALVIVAGTASRELRGTCYRWPKAEEVVAEVVEPK